MKTIWKFEIVSMDNGKWMPKVAEVLSVGSQGSALFFWAIVDPKAEKELRRFGFSGTGHPVPDGIKKFLGTVQQIPPFVWHCFELEVKP